MPRGYDPLAPLLESDAELRRSFFSRLDVMFYAGAALPQNLFDRLLALMPMRLFDTDDPSKGLVFDGRVAEDFKLQSGTWVHAGAVRVRLIAACNPLVQDAVITGHDRTEVGALVWLNLAAARSLDEAAVFARLQTTLASLHAEGAGNSLTPARLLVLEHPSSIDAGEITNKGYVNQRAVRENRAVHAERLHAGDTGVIVHVS